jgi:hypothetical protein
LWRIWQQMFPKYDSFFKKKKLFFKKLNFYFIFFFTSK